VLAASTHAAMTDPLLTVLHSEFVCARTHRRHVKFSGYLYTNRVTTIRYRHCYVTGNYSVAELRDF
jgi:hypothetical protein